MVINLTKYAGRHVAIDVPTWKVIASAEYPDELIDKLKKANIDMKRIEIMYVLDRNEHAIFAGSAKPFS